MRLHFLTGLVAAVLSSATVSFAAPAAHQGHYMFAWAGDQDHRGEDFIAVIDADPASATGYDAATQRIAVSGYGEARVFMLIVDPGSGALQLDRAFHEATGRPGFDTGSRSWPHGWSGAAFVHGIVFSK